MNQMNKYLFVFFLFLLARIAEAQDTTQKIIPGRINSAEQQKKPYVILISADGFRYDLAEKYHALHLLQLREQGINASYMQPAFPSLTFPNHYSLLTGLYPAHHGIVDNTFFDKKKQAMYSLGNKVAVADSSWYGGTPLWVLAEKQHMMSASFYWVASESAIQGTRPSYYYVYNDIISMDRRIEAIKNWLQLPEDKRPHLITFYFPEVDHQEHTFGPNSKETEEAVHLVDESMGKMVKTVDSLGLNVNFIFLSDHGMTYIDTVATISMPQAIDTNKFVITRGGSISHLYAKDPVDIRPTYEALKKEARDYDVYLAKKLPKRWHYSKKDDVYDRTGDIILVAKMPKAFRFSRRKMPVAEHGYDPAFPEMRASFYAWGPAFREHMKIEGFENVHVYPLIAEILGLDITEKIDGRVKVLKPFLKE